MFDFTCSNITPVDLFETSRSVSRNLSILSHRCRFFTPGLRFPLGNEIVSGPRGGTGNSDRCRLRIMRGWGNTVEVVLLEISNSMKQYPSLVHASISKSRPVISLVEQNISMRLPTVFHKQKPETSFVITGIWENKKRTPGICGRT